MPKSFGLPILYALLIGGVSMILFSCATPTAGLAPSSSGSKPASTAATSPTPTPCFVAPRESKSCGFKNIIVEVPPQATPRPLYVWLSDPIVPITIEPPKTPALGRLQSLMTIVVSSDPQGKELVNNFNPALTLKATDVKNADKVKKLILINLDLKPSEPKAWSWFDAFPVNSTTISATIPSLTGKDPQADVGF